MIKNWSGYYPAATSMVTLQINLKIRIIKPWSFGRCIKISRQGDSSSDMIAI